MLRGLVLSLAVVSAATGAWAAPKKAVRASARPTAAAPPQSSLAKAVAVAKRNAARLRVNRFAAQDSLESFVGMPFSAAVEPTTSYRDGVLDIYADAGAIYPQEDADFKDPNRFERHPTLEVTPVQATARGGYVGQNAYGAKARVTMTDIDYAVVVLTNRPEYDNEYRVRVRLPGPEAKALRESVRIVVSGKIGKTNSGKVVGCENRYISATISSPSAGRVQECWVAAELETITMIDSRTQKVLRQWTPQDPLASSNAKPAPITLQP